MTPAEALRLLQLESAATRDQIEQRFLEQKTLLEEKAAKALTPGLQAQYREGIARLTTAYETLVLAEESAAMPALQAPPPPVAPAAPAPATPPVAPATTPEIELQIEARADSAGRTIGRHVEGMIKCGFALLLGLILTTTLVSWLREEKRLPQDDLLAMAVFGGIWALTGLIPGIAWWRHSVAVARQLAVDKARAIANRGSGTTPLPRRRTSLVPSLVLAGVALVLSFAWWMDGRPLRSGRAAIHRAESARLANDFAGEVKAAREAVDFYPLEGEFILRQAEAQRRWLADLRQRAAAAGPLAGRGLITDEGARLKPWLNDVAKGTLAEAEKEALDAFGAVLPAEFERLGALADAGKFAEVRAEVKKLEPYAKKDATVSEFITQILRAEFFAAMEPANTLAQAGDFAGARAKIDEIRAKGWADSTDFQENVVLIHLMEIRKETETFKSLLEEGAFDTARELITELSFLADRSTKLPRFEEMAGQKPEDAVAAMETVLVAAWRRALFKQVSHELATALAERDAAAAQGILGVFAKLTDTELPFSGQDLVAERSLDRLIERLTSIGLRTSHVEEPAIHADIILVEALRDRLEQPERVRLFLADSYRNWGERLLEKDMAGLALYTMQRASEEGYVSDGSLEATARAKFATENALTLSVVPVAVKNDDGPEEATAVAQLVVADVNAALRAAITRAVGELIQFKDLDSPDSAEPRDVMLAATVQPISTAMGEQQERKSVRRKSGEVRGRNPEHVQKEAQIADLTAALKSQSEGQSLIARELGAARLKQDTAREQQLMAAAERNHAASVRTREQLTKASAELAEIPPTALNSLYSVTELNLTTYHVHHEAALTLRLVNDQLPEDTPPLATWQANLRYATAALPSNSAGIPEQTPTFLNEEAITGRLAQDFLAKVNGQSPAWLAELANTLEQQRLNQLRNDRGDTATLDSDWRWGWRATWGSAGVNLPSAEAETAVRLALNLPDRVPDRPYRPSAGWQMENFLGQRFAALPSVDKDAEPILFAISETRAKDYALFARELNLPHTAMAVGEELPATNVSWEDAQAFCLWLTRKEQASGLITSEYAYRLPTKAEWIAAARLNEVGERTRAGAGNLAGLEALGGSVGDNEIVPRPGYHDGYATLSPVGAFGSGALGLSDLEGNVSEWVQDESTDVPGLRVTCGTDYASGELSASLTDGESRFAAPSMRNATTGFRLVLARR